MNEENALQWKVVVDNPYFVKDRKELYLYVDLKAKKAAKKNEAAFCFFKLESTYHLNRCVCGTVEICCILPWLYSWYKRRISSAVSPINGPYETMASP